MAPNLLDLPNEILAKVFSNLDTTHLRPCNWDLESGKFLEEEYTNCRPSLYAVTQVNRRLHEIARRVLLEDVSILIESSGPKCPPRFDYDAVRFTSHCGENPAVLEHMKKFRISWHTPTPEGWSFNLFDIVSRAPNLIVFNIASFRDYAYPGVEMSILEMLIGRLRLLEVFTIDLTELDIPPRLFLAICDMPRLHSFMTDRPILGLESRGTDNVDLDDFYDDAPRGHLQETRLEKLRCTGDYLDPAVLRHVLSRSPRLKRLTLTLPGLGLHPYRRVPPDPDDPDRKDSEPPFRPGLASRMLLPCAPSLCELAITNKNMGLSQTDGTTIDLSSFSNLRKLTISNRLICKVIDQGSEESPYPTIELPVKEWYKSLPTGLASLKIQFDCTRGLLWNLITLRLLENEYNADWVKGDSDVQAAALVKWHSEFEIKYFAPCVSKEIQEKSFHQLSWVMDSASIMRDKLPYLKEFRIVESLDVPVDECANSWELVDLVQVYPDVFSISGIDLELSVRVPLEYVPPPLEMIGNVLADGMSRDAALSVSEPELLRALVAQESRHETYRRVMDWDSTRPWGDDE